MSDVISFRLNPDNPREAKAVQVLQTWAAQGFSIRQIITEALLKLDAPEIGFESATIEGLKDTLDHVNQLLEHIEIGKYSPVIKSHTEPAQTGLTDSFITSVKMIAKPGLKSN
jgi:hypothetical protein